MKHQSSNRTPLIAAALLGCTLLSATTLPAQPMPAINVMEARKTIEYLKKPIDYGSEKTNDPIALLQKRIDKGEVKLTYDEEHGYLRSVLQALDIPMESQVLVFSKTAFNKQLVGPRTPRALYFNDDVYIGWIPELNALEITAVDPQKGAMFYLLPQESEKTPPKFKRHPNCLTCHATSGSEGVPGHLLRSFQTDKVGNPTSGLKRITHDTPLEKRWAGWYVTGLHGDEIHLGNMIGSGGNPAFSGNLTSLKSYFDVNMYLVPGSDIVALMVIDHQAHMQNLITRFNYETRLKRKNTVEDKLLRYLFFIDEPALKGEFLGNSEYTDIFEFFGPEDSMGRSLRQFDLKTRTFKYRLSYQIYSKAFQQLPVEGKNRLYKRIYDILTGKEKSKDYQVIPQKERQAILEILRDTIPDLPAYYR